jgi:hypothetical protein
VPTVQSIRFLKLPGSAPAYSGVLKMTASAASICCWSRCTAGWEASSSGTKAGRSIRPSNSTAGPRSAAVRSAAVFVESFRVLPEINRSVTSCTVKPAADEKASPHIAGAAALLPSVWSLK